MIKKIITAILLYFSLNPTAVKVWATDEKLSEKAEELSRSNTHATQIDFNACLYCPDQLLINNKNTYFDYEKYINEFRCILKDNE